MSFKKHGSRFLKGIRDFRVTPEQSSAVMLNFLQALDCPRSLTVAMLMLNNEHEQLAKLEFNPLHYRNVVELGDAYAATKFLSKYQDLNLDYDLDKVALAKFEKFENDCRSTNARFRNLSADPKYKGRVVWLHNAVIRKIEGILGEFSPVEMFDIANWGPGASTLIKRREASSTNKFQSETGITRDLYALIPDHLLEEKYPLWWAHLKSVGTYPTFQVGNKVVTVPKDATTNRVIAIEPGFNLWFQKAIGKMMRRRLRRYGVDLRWQSVNQELALEGSKHLQLATLDFSSASDSIAKGVVRELLPPLWHTILDSCRSHFGVQEKDKPVLWEKFSSMGNGFTFELETLIFFATAKCCAEYLHLDAKASECISVYGDDVIIPIACLELFAEMSAFYGFTLNVKKSHYSSTFRESCGKHYVSGVDVTPVYLKSKLSDVPSVYRLANAVRRFAHRRNASYGCDVRLKATYDHLVSLVPKSLRLMIPEGIGDGGFICNFDEAAPVRMRHGVEGYRVSHLREVSKTYQSDVFGLLLSRLWQSTLDFEDTSNLRAQATVLKFGPSDYILAILVDGEIDSLPIGTKNSVPVKGRKEFKLTKDTVVHQWYDLGPWL